MGNRNLLLIGGGGHCKSVIDSLLECSTYDKIGIIEKDESMLEKTVQGIPIVGTDSELEKFYLKGYAHAFITLGSIGNLLVRKHIYDKLKLIGFTLPNIIDKTSIKSSKIKLGEGIYIGKNVTINVETTIGDGAILNTGCIVEHECTIKNFVHIGPGCILCGNVIIDNFTNVGAGSMIKQGIHIGSNSMIGMGSVIVKNVNSNVIAYGNPCREVKEK